MIIFFAIGACISSSGLPLNIAGAVPRRTNSTHSISNIEINIQQSPIPGLDGGRDSATSASMINNNPLLMSLATRNSSTSNNNTSVISSAPSEGGRDNNIIFNDTMYSNDTMYRTSMLNASAAKKMEEEVLKKNDFFDGFL